MIRTRNRHTARGKLGPSQMGCHRGSLHLLSSVVTCATWTLTWPHDRQHKADMTYVGCILMPCYSWDSTKFRACMLWIYRCYWQNTTLKWRYWRIDHNLQLLLDILSFVSYLILLLTVVVNSVLCRFSVDLWCQVTQCDSETYGAVAELPQVIFIIIIIFIIMIIIISITRL